MAELDREYGTYIKSFTTVIYATSCTKVKMMNSRHPRLHHSITWNNAAPVIIREKFKLKS